MATKSEQFLYHGYTFEQEKTFKEIRKEMTETITNELANLYPHQTLPPIMSEKGRIKVKGYTVPARKVPPHWRGAPNSDEGKKKR